MWVACQAPSKTDRHSQLDLLNDDRELRRAGAQPQLGTGSSHPILAGYGFLQAPDVAVHLEALPENAGVVRPVQSDLFGASGRHVRDRGDCRAVGARPEAAVSKIGTGLAGREHVLWTTWNF